MPQVFLHDQPVDDDLDRVLQLLVELDLLVEVALLAVDLHPREALGPGAARAGLGSQPAVLDDRRVDRELRPLGWPGAPDRRSTRSTGPRSAVRRAGAIRPSPPSRTAAGGSRSLRDRPDRRARFRDVVFSSIEIAGRARRSSPRRASPSSGGTRRHVGGRAARRSGADLPRRSCRRRARTSGPREAGRAR